MVANDVRRGWLDGQVHDLIRMEDGLDEALRATLAADAGIGVAPGLSTIAASPARHVDALYRYLGERAERGSTTQVDADESAVQPGEGDVLGRALVGSFTRLANAVIRYAALFEAALRLYDEELRVIAPQHQADYSAAMYVVAGAIAPAIAADLSARGLECHCVCPMCSLGLCGCVAVGRETATTPTPAVDATPSAPGFVIQKPRGGSQLADLGIAAGDLLLEIDGRPTSGVLEIQKAIRAHDLGGTMRLLIVHDGRRLEVDVTHVHDY